MRNYISALILLLIGYTSCSTNTPNQTILMFRERDGIYQLDLSINKEKCIFKDSGLKNFSRSNKLPRLENETLTFKAGREYHESKRSIYEERKYTDVYNSIDIEIGKCWISKKVTHLINKKEEKESIRTEGFNQKGELITETDTVIPYYNKPKLSIINGIRSEILGIQKRGDKSVFSFDGNIYMIEKNDTIQLTHFDGYFPGYTRGYHTPIFDPTNQYTIFNFQKFRVIFNDEQRLSSVNLKTKEMKVLKKGEYIDYSFSNDGKFLLFSRDGRDDESERWVYEDIYILDLTTMRERKIGVASFAMWGNSLS